MTYHKSYWQLLLIIAIILFSTQSYAFNIVGTWSLISMQRQNQQGLWQDDCNAPKGFLIYNASGYVSAGINCMEETTSAIPSKNPHDMTFYIAKYHLKGNKLTHEVQVTANLNLYGKILSRELQIINNNDMVLNAISNGHLVKLHWHRV